MSINRQDILVGAIQGPETEVQDQLQQGRALLTILTLGPPGKTREISAHAIWNPLERDWPEMKEGAVMRFWGWLDRQSNQMELAQAEPVDTAMFSVLVCGGRNFQDYQSVQEELGMLAPSRIIHGGANGADSLGGRYARENRIDCRKFPAIWRPADGRDPVTGRALQKGYNPRAGFQRNERMLHEGRPDLVMAFPGGNGTAHMVRTARQEIYDVQEVPERR